MTQRIMLGLVLVVANLPVLLGRQRSPLPYSTREVSYAGGDTGVELSATLYVPLKVKKPAVVVLVPGTGRQDRTSKMGPFDYYQVIIGHMCSKGIAVLWADDRGVGKSTGSFEEATTADFARDVVASVSFLKTIKQIDSKRIGVLGHSEGGTMAILAAAQSKDVAFMISLAGVSVKGLSSVMKQNQGIVAVSPIADTEKAAYDTINNRLFRAIHDHVDEPDVDTLLMKIFVAWKKEVPGEVLSRMRFDSYRGDRYIQHFMAYTHSRWYRYMILSDPAPHVAQITVPVLAVNGDRDIMVNADDNLEAFRKNLSPGLDVTLKKMPGLNHMLQHCKACTNDEYVKLDEAISPEVLEIVGEWIKRR